VRHLLATSILVLSATLMVGCAPKVAREGKSANPLAVSNWKLPSWSKNSDSVATKKSWQLPWSKKSNSVATKKSWELPWSKNSNSVAKKSWELPWSKKPRSMAISQKPEPKNESAVAKFSDSVKESSFAKGVSSAWDKTTNKLTSLTDKNKATSPADDPVSLAGKTPEPNLKTHTAWAKLLETSGNNEEADEHYRQALAIDPTNLEALLGRAHLIDRQGKLVEATGLYELACQHHPNESRAFNDLGLCLARQHKLTDSLTALNRAAQLQPRRKLYRNNLATVLAELSRHDEAYSHLEAVHGPAVAHYNMGFLLNKKGETETAAFHFQSAAKADPNLISAQRWAEHLLASRPATPSPTRPVANSSPGRAAVQNVSEVHAPNVNPLR